MKIIDKTPFQDEKGEIGFLNRLQGTLQYGFSWYPELEVQKNVIAQLDRTLVKGFVLIRNFTLPGLGVIEPIILIGPSGISVIYVTHLSGVYEAKGDQWNVVSNGRSTPVADNLITRVARLAKALQVYLERQGVHIPNPIEPILIASNPAMHIDSMRPTVRVVQSDGIKPFATSLLQARPVLQTEVIHDLAERIINAHPAAAQPAAQTPPQAAQAPTQESASPSRAQAIFRAAEETPPLNPNDLGFAFDDSPAAATPLVGQSAAANSGQAAPAPARKKARRILGMTISQLLFLAVLFLLLLCIMAAGSYFIFFLK